jgi:hypothetical protein
MNTVRVERRWIREGVPRPRIEMRVPLVALAALCAVCVCFASFYAVGRAMQAGRTARVEAAPSLSVASVSAAIPVRLSSAQPLDVAPEAAPATRPNPSPAAPTQSEVFHAPLGLPQAAPAVSSAPVREQAAPETHNSSPQPTPAAPPAEAHSAPPQPAPAAAPATSGAAGGHGLFDSSG